MADNDTFAHPGEGRNLYIDAHPQPIYNLTGAPWRARVQVYDAPFSLKKADSFTLHINSQPQYIRGQAAQPLFDDTKTVLLRGAAEPRRQAPGDRRQDQGSGAERHLDEGPLLLIH